MSAEPQWETEVCPACNGAGFHMWGDALAIYADPCGCASSATPGRVKRTGIPCVVDLRVAYA